MIEPTAREKTARATVDAINAMVKRLGDEDYYLAYNSATRKYRVYGDISDSHSESSLYAILIFEEDRLLGRFARLRTQGIQICRPRIYLYIGPRSTTP